MSNSAQRRKKKQQGIDRTIKNGKIEVPSYIKLKTFDSPEWLQRTQKDEVAYSLGRGLALQLWSDLPTQHQPCFVGEDPLTVRDSVFNALTDEQMLPIERKFIDSFGGFGSLSYDHWADKVFKLWSPNHLSYDADLLAWCIEDLKNSLKTVLPNGVLTPLSIDESLQSMQGGRNSGWPFFTSQWNKRNDKGEYDNTPHIDEKRLTSLEMVNWYKNMGASLLNGKDTLSGCPYILFKRSTPNGIDTPKMRPVECPPKHESIVAKCFSKPLMDSMKQLFEFQGFKGGENLAEETSELMFSKNYVIEGDFSSFDSTCGGLMPHIFELLRDLTNHSHDAYFNVVEHYYKHPELLTPQGLVSSDTNSAGLLSGSGWTTIIGTLCNAIAVRYATTKLGNDYHSQVMNMASGDDIALACDHFDVEKFELYMTELGLLCNKSKQQYSKVSNSSYFSFLGYYHFNNRKGGVFPIMRMLPKLVYKESHTDLDSLIEGSDLTEEEIETMKTANKRGIDILSLYKKLENCSNHKDFNFIVDLVVEKQDDHLNPTYAVSYEKLAHMLRSGRSSRLKAFSNSPVLHQVLTNERYTHLKDMITNDANPLAHQHDNASDISQVNTEDKISDEMTRRRLECQSQASLDESNSEPPQLDYCALECDKTKLHELAYPDNTLNVQGSPGYTSNSLSPSRLTYVVISESPNNESWVLPWNPKLDTTWVLAEFSEHKPVDLDLLFSQLSCELDTQSVPEIPTWIVISESSTFTQPQPIEITNGCVLVEHEQRTEMNDSPLTHAPLSESRSQEMVTEIFRYSQSGVDYVGS